MRYSIRSDTMAELTGKSPGVFRRVVSWFLLPICYLGALIAPSVVLTISFQGLHRGHFLPHVFWFVTALVGVVVLWIAYFEAVGWLRYFRQGVIYIEAIVIFIGFLAVIPVALLAFPPG